ncbi:hypothetical protein Tco_0965978 [Tanacetum coccineum]
MPRYIAWDKVDNPSPQSTPQVLSLFEEYPLPVPYPEEVEKTLGTPMEVEPLDETQLEDLCLNTCNHDIPLSSREVHSFDEPEPQPNPLLSCPSLDVSLGDERGPEPPIKPHSVDFSKLEVVEDDWELEFKEVSFLGRGLNLLVRPKEVEKVRIRDSHHLEHIFQHVFQHMAPLHHNGVYRYYHPHLTLSVGKPSPLSVE